jgi:hypothetical protein
MKNNIILSIFSDRRTVFRLKDIALLTNDANFQSLNRKINYAVRTGKLMNPRKGIYVKPGYNTQELACSVFTPCYISLEYVLQRAGVIFQYDTTITSISYLSRKIVIDGNNYSYRKLKNNVLLNTSGILRKEDNTNIATAERAFLDMLYLEKDYYFDNINPLDKEKLEELLPAYNSKELNKRLNKLLKAHG